MREEILDFVRERGILLEKEVFDLIYGLNDSKAAKDLIKALEESSGQKIISRAILNKNFEFVKNIARDFPGEQKSYLESVFVKLGLSLEIKKESEVFNERKEFGQTEKAERNPDYKVHYAETKPEKKLEVRDFVSNFRARYQSMQRILMGRAELTNLTSINKISSERKSVSIIGIVSEKRITKNKNMIIKLEDLTGEISVLVKADNRELFLAAEELLLDDVVGVRASGNKDLLFAHGVYYPDTFNAYKTKFEEDINIVFLSDVHCGSKAHLEKSFSHFLEWINSDDEDAKKVKYIFFTGDNVDGVGIFPGQEKFLLLKSMKEQYEMLYSYINQIPKRITMFMCPGQHDASRVAEPQPIISRKYAPNLYGIENLILVTSPAMVRLIEKEKEFKVLMYHGASLNHIISEIKELRMMKAHRCPAAAVKHLLKRRHLAPTHSSVVYIPNADKDPLVIDEVPDIICTGDLHRSDIENYNGVLIIAGSCWQAQTDFMEKVGAVPDPGKAILFNLKNREIKIYNFLDDEEKTV